MKYAKEIKRMRDRKERRYVCTVSGNRWIVALFILAAISAFGQVPSETRVPKALVIMLDGLRADVVENGDLPYMKKLMEGKWQPGYKGAWSLCASTIRDGSTESAPNHVAIATGMTTKKTGISWNPDLVCTAGTDTRKWPTWLARLAKERRGTRALHIFSWYGDLNISPDYGVRFIFDRDPENAQLLKKMMAESDAPDAVMWYIDRPDHAGHGSGYYPYSSQYLKAVHECDDEIGSVLDAIASRPTFGQEDWLFYITSDHGGWEGYHGQSSTQCYTVPVILVGRHIEAGRIAATVHNYDAAPTALAHFGVDISMMGFDGNVTGNQTVTDTARPWKDGLAVYLPFDGGKAENRGSAEVSCELHGGASIPTNDGRFGGFLRVSAATNRAGYALLKGSEKLQFENGNEFTFAMWVRTFGPQVGDPVVLCNKNWSGGSNPGVALIASRHVDMSRTSGYNFKKKGHHTPGFMFNCGREGKKREDLGVYNPEFGKWVFYAMTRGADGKVRFYQGRSDGYLYCVADDLSDIAFATGMPFYIGQDGRGIYERPFVGDVDELAIWTRGFTHGEVREIWNFSKQGKRPIESPR